MLWNRERVQLVHYLSIGGPYFGLSCSSMFMEGFIQKLFSLLWLETQVTSLYKLSRFSKQCFCNATCPLVYLRHRFFCSNFNSFCSRKHRCVLRYFCSRSELPLCSSSTTSFDREQKKNTGERLKSFAWTQHLQSKSSTKNFTTELPDLESCDRDLEDQFILY